MNRYWRALFVCSTGVFILNCGWKLCPQACGDGYQCMGGVCVKTSSGEAGPGGQDASAEAFPTPFQDASTAPDASLCFGAGCLIRKCSMSCPDGMTKLGDSCSCMDQYEASIKSADQSAASVPGALPWTNVTITTAASACAKAGKRLCTKAEWQNACVGTKTCDLNCKSNCACFAFGTTFKNVCGTSVVSSVAIYRTGEFTECVGGYAGIYDLAGNVEEWLHEEDCGMSGSYCLTAGGAFNTASEDALSCAASIRSQTQGLCDIVGEPSCEITQPSISPGFRCCMSLAF